MDCAREEGQVVFLLGDVPGVGFCAYYVVVATTEVAHRAGVKIFSVIVVLMCSSVQEVGC